MEDNTSRIEEDEFIETLNEEMPEVFENIKDEYGLLNRIDATIKDMRKNKSID